MYTLMLIQQTHRASERASERSIECKKREMYREDRRQMFLTFSQIGCFSNMLCVCIGNNNIISEFNFIEFIHLLVPFSLLLLLPVLTCTRHKFEIHEMYTANTKNTVEQHQQNDN